ncbi:uncharacterized protein TRIADDRAFT_55185 [Trichoplax adhaerens]|uniref:glutathione transferase n=1 Tax=Trichoplax adhaerens TaxID=10228 RepID=B3RU78_TRIAD|nr:hypothetical protein TRIADDRAFT_55185 [Trichoplax adhaerens]EDV25292.1 hypothetical protein TRIADDRAFT_55185 [Trichoplax adhaerens]|eukprot:XP_002111325.1 hypothetical protein TRIADDRAFT_55185 [Trichoplax adhaerens]
MPILEVNGNIISQSTTVCRYLAHTIGIDSKDSFQKTQIDMIAETCTRDIAEKFYNYRSSMKVPDEPVRLSYVDFAYYCMMITNVMPVMNNFSTSYPKSSDVYTRIAKEPKIEEWERTKPEIRM